jgi:hypothetical protein
MVIEHSYPVAPAALLAILTDPQYQAARLERFGGVGGPEISSDGGQILVRGVRQLPKDKLPAAAAPFVGDGQLVQVDTWQSPGSDAATVEGTWKAEVGSAPVDLGGTYTITTTGDGSTYSVGATVKVNVPFFGRQLEPQIESYLNSLVSAEQEFLAEWVAQHE